MSSLADKWQQRIKSRKYAETHPGTPIPGTKKWVYRKPKGRMPYSRLRKGGGYSNGKHTIHAEPQEDTT